MAGTKKKKELMYTAGPTEIPRSVLRALSSQIINPDLDERFFDLYDSLCEKIKKIGGTKKSSLFVLAGEGMVALDAAVANLVSRKDPVLVIASGVFGDGFADMVKNYGGNPVIIKSEYDTVVPPEEVERTLEKYPEIRVATFVHCETPSGTIASLKDVGRVCNDHDVILIADTVSSLGGVPVEGDRNFADICLGASQKCFSAPPGLATISVSNRAWEKIESRKAKVESFYLDLMQWKKMWLGDRVFPYTQSVSDIFALNAAVDMILEEGLEVVYKRHSKVAEYVRSSCEEMGLELYPRRRDICSDTVSALKLPSGVSDKKLRERMLKKHGVAVAGSWGKLSGRVIRLGHMGYNAHLPFARRAVEALSESIKAV